MRDGEGSCGSDRVPVYRVSYVVWMRAEADDGRRRLLREDWFGAGSVEEARALAADHGRTAPRLEPGWSFEGVEVSAVTLLFVMERCGRCGTFPGPEDSGVRCLCDGLACSRCGRRKMWRPISERYDEATGRFVHVPWLLGMWKTCRECLERERRRRKGKWLP